MENSIKEISTCAISGAVGTFANIDPRVENYVAKKLKLSIEPISTQIIPRDRHAQFLQLWELLQVQLKDLQLKLDIYKELKFWKLKNFWKKTKRIFGYAT